MRGDFSAWNKDRAHNFRGTLHQQGRVLLDRDWNAQTEITGEWQETAARDAFGPGVAAVPSGEPGGFKVVKAEITGGVVRVSMMRGRAWADGLLVQLARDPEPPPLPAGVDAIRTATYLGAPIQPAPPVTAVPAVGDRDAVILETWLEELSAYQRPDLLYEPALGGVDTTERVLAACRLRLYRMAAGDTCESIISKLQDDFSAKGMLSVELSPTAAIDGDCPVVESGGFTGFEHRLYRIEIAATDRPSPEAWFKWSAYNGGLVGSGDINAARKVAIVGNRNAILYSGLTSFYFEALDFDAALGCWQVVYGAKATLGPDGMLALPDPMVTPGDVFKGTIPAAPATGHRCFRLWNGIERVNAFSAAKTPLPDNLGILIQFDAEAAGKYTPSDFWTFEVRAGGLPNPVVLVAHLPPQGIAYHRVPIAEVDWTSTSVTGAGIEDCRRVFPPLTGLRTCCSYRVGDGVDSHGDFKKIQDAINALPADGGEICVLPGTYPENVVIAPPHNKDVTLKGCGARSIVKAVTAAAAIHVKYGRNVRIESLAIEAHADGVGILLEGQEPEAKGSGASRYLKDIALARLTVTAVNKSAIKAYVAQTLALTDSAIRIGEAALTRHPAVYLAGDDMLVERNEIRVVTARAQADKQGHELTNDPDLWTPAQFAAGGLQIGGGSERVRILNNVIVSGAGNGITLGSIDVRDNGKVVTIHDPFEPKGAPVDCCNPDDGHTDPGGGDVKGRTPIAGAPLADVLIGFNRIFNMGRNGIGVVTFFDMPETGAKLSLEAVKKGTTVGIVSVSRLVILENRIERCLNGPLPAIPPALTLQMGFGGISLADVEGLVIRDNYIADNGPDFLEPVCGIFVLMAEAVEISRNQILNNGARRTAEVTAQTIKDGARGGIFIVRAKTPGVDAAPATPGQVLMASGRSAAIHDNVVTVPLGRSLTLIATGAVSVTGNALTSFGVPPTDFSELLVGLFGGAKGTVTGTGILELLSLIAGNVLILNLGRAGWLAGSTGFSGVATLDPATMTGAPADADKAGARVRFEGGATLFANNQCHQNLAIVSRGFSVSSIFLASLDDIGFNANQCDCDFDNEFFIVDAAAFGVTVRLSDNRFAESFARVLYSAATFGVQNVTTDNESVHCLLVRGGAFLDRYNLVLIEIGAVHGDVTKSTGVHFCAELSKMIASFGRQG